MCPVKFLRFLWSFSQRCKREQLRYYTGLGAKSVEKTCHAVRLCLLCIVTNLLMTEKLGGPGKVVMIDETCVSTKKRKKGVQGRRTAGNQQWVLGFWEMDLTTRQGTGRTLLVILSGRIRKFLEADIRNYVHVG